MRKIVDKVTGILAGSLLSVMVIVACWQVFTRFVLNSPSVVSEEFLRFGLIWLTMVGSAYVYGQKQHLAIVIVAKKVPKKFQLLVNILVEAFVLLFSIVILIMGGMTAFQNAVGQVSPALRLPMEYLYLCLPIGGVLFVFYSALGLKEHFKKHKLVTQERNS